MQSIAPLGWMWLFAGAVAAVSGQPWVGGLNVVLGGAIVGSAWWSRKAFRAARDVTEARDEIARGDAARAEQLLARVDAAKGPLARSVALQRAMLAVQRSEFDEAILQASRATVADRIPGAQARIQHAAAYACRALAHASLAHDAEAEADADRVEREALALPDALARAALARAVLLARSDGVAKLRDHLRARGSLMLEHLEPRERTLVRALRMLARAPATSVYREPAVVDADAADDDAWVRAVAPAAAAHVTAGVHAKRVLPFDARVNATTAVQAEAERAAPRDEKRLGFGGGLGRAHGATLAWVLLVVLFLVVRQVLAPATGTGASDVSAATATPVSTFTIVPFVIVASVIFLVFARRQQRQLLHARRRAMLGEDEAAAPILERLAKSVVVGIAASAHLVLAEVAARHARWSDVLAHADDGLARIHKNRTARALQADALVPDLMTMRGVALAALGRETEAEAVRLVLTRDHSTYAASAVAHFRIRLYEALARGDVPEATAIAQGRNAELPLSLRDETLVDLVLAAAFGLPDRARARIDGELADDAGLRAWIDAIAPRLRDVALAARA